MYVSKYQTNRKKEKQVEIELTEKVDNEASIRQTTSGSVKESATIWKIDRETESWNESTRIRVWITEHE